MTDPTRPTTVAEQEESSQMDRTEQEIQDLRDEVQCLLASLEDSRTLHRDAAASFAIAERHAAQLVELNMAWEAKATAAIEQRDAALHDLQRSREAHAACVQMLTEQYTAWAQAHEQVKAERDAAVAERDRLDIARLAALKDRDDWVTALRSVAPGSIPSHVAAKTAIRELHSMVVRARDERDELRTANERLQGLLVEMHDALVARSTVLRRQGQPGAARQWGNWAERAAALTPRDPAAQGVTTLEFHHQTEDMMRDTAKAIREGIRHACEYGVDPCPQCIAEGTTPSARVARLQAEQEICTGPAPDSPAFQRLIQELDEAWADRIAEDACTVGRGIDRQTIHNPPAPEAAAPDSPALPVTRDLNSGHETNEWKLRDVTGRELPIWIGGRELADFVVAALNASTPAPEAGKPTDEERLDWLEANWMGALTRDDTFVESDGRSLRDLIDYHRARAQREREGK